MITLVDSNDETFNHTFFANLTGLILQHTKREFETDCEVSVILTTDEEIKALNSRYRNLGEPTDVLSFTIDEPLMLGDIAISADTAQRQAVSNGNTLRKELVQLYIHGFLHLLGFNHELSQEEAGIMFSVEAEIIKLWERIYG
jgi:probable rRNA maturation factor